MTLAEAAGGKENVLSLGKACEKPTGNARGLKTYFL